MPMSPAARQRRRFCIALPAVVLAGTTGAIAHAGPSPLDEADWQLLRGVYEVKLNLDLFGETSRPVVQARNGRYVTVAGTHGDTPWRLEFVVTRFYQSDQLLVRTKLTSGDAVLAAPVRTINVGQRVVVRADDAMNVALLIKRV